MILFMNKISEIQNQRCNLKIELLQLITQYDFLFSGIKSITWIVSKQVWQHELQFKSQYELLQQPNYKYVPF